MSCEADRACISKLIKFMGESPFINGDSHYHHTSYHHYDYHHYYHNVVPAGVTVDTYG